VQQFHECVPHGRTLPPALSRRQSSLSCRNSPLRVFVGWTALLFQFFLNSALTSASVRREASTQVGSRSRPVTPQAVAKPRANRGCHSNPQCDGGRHVCPANLASGTEPPFPLLRQPRWLLPAAIRSFPVLLQSPPPLGPNAAFPRRLPPIRLPLRRLPPPLHD